MHRFRGRAAITARVAACLVVGTIAFAFAATPAQAAETLTDAQIRQLIIRESLSSYPGNCPCPWNSDRAGRMCGRRSAYNKPGGYAPKCFAEDISDDEVKRFRSVRGV